jgi:hypothetical protein
MRNPERMPAILSLLDQAWRRTPDITPMGESTLN